MTCPRCAASSVSPDTGACNVCGFRPDGSLSVAGADALMEVVARQLAHEFDIVGIAGRRDGARVLRAVEKHRRRDVILKVVQRRNDDPGAESRFRSVLEAYQRLDHPHLVPILRFGSTDGLLWLTMPDTGAKPLREQFDGGERLEPQAVRRIATQLVSALEYLHRQDLVHGAVKAENIFVDAQGWAWLADPACERPLPPRRRTPTQGTRVSAPSESSANRHPWMAPEDLARTERLPTSDQFGLAAVLFEAVAGRMPLETGERVLRSLADVPLPMSNALARALDAQPARRFPSCADFLFALEQSGPEHRASGRTSTDQFVIHDWEPSQVAARSAPKRMFVVLGLVSLIAVAVSAPTLLRIYEETREPLVAATTPVPPPVAPADTAPTLLTPPPSATRVVAPAPTRAETGIPPSSIPRPAAPRRTQPPAAPPVVEMARLTINASPWGQVFIDDVLVGNTPRANIEVAAGERVIRVSRQGFSTFTRTIRLQPGESLRITDIVLTPVSP